MTLVERAGELLHTFKGDAYIYGAGVLPRIGERVAAVGTRAALVRDPFPGSAEPLDVIRRSLAAAGVTTCVEVDGARPNAPREDLARITEALRVAGPDVVVSFGGGSTIDAAKAAMMLVTLGGRIDDYFGTALVTAALEARSAALPPHVAVQTAASSASHLSKYANITDVARAQKKLVVDEAVTPAWPVFDHTVTYTAPPALTADGALDGIASCLEVLLGAVGRPHYDAMCELAPVGVGLVLEHLPVALASPRDAAAREALALATDLGGYAIMLGGTSGPHLNSFSLVNVMSHGRACALLGPYYTVFYAPACEEPLRLLGDVYRRAGLLSDALDQLHGRELGVAVARAMIAFLDRAGLPTRLRDVPGVTPDLLERTLAAAKDPQLRMKLENMPVPLTADLVDAYMGPVLRAAYAGDLELVRNL